LSLSDRKHRRHPGLKPRLKSRPVELVEHSLNRVVRRNAVGEFQSLLEPLGFTFAEQLDFFPRFRSAQHRTNRQADDVPQSVVTFGADAWVGQVMEIVSKGVPVLILVQFPAAVVEDAPCHD
jgi:hypothetical protein